MTRAILFAFFWALLGIAIGRRLGDRIGLNSTQSANIFSFAGGIAGLAWGSKMRR